MGNGIQKVEWQRVLGEATESDLAEQRREEEIYSLTRKSLVNQKLEQEKQSLDPLRNPPHLHLYHHQKQTQNPEEEEEEKREQHIQQQAAGSHGFHHFHQSQDFFQQNQLFYGRLNDPQHQQVEVSVGGAQLELQTQPLKKRSYFPSSSTKSQEQSGEHARLRENMEENSRRRQTSSRLGLRNAGGVGGEIVEVQGGHIVRSTGRKDRHSKVCTAKGPRDRRVRLAAHTAIQFYDVQDRLGYDRPSKAVDWLIKKAKAAIDELAQLPAWDPTTGLAGNADAEQEEREKQLEDEGNPRMGIRHSGVLDTNLAGPSSKRAMSMLGNENGQQGLQHQSSNTSNSNANDASFLPPSLDSDAIADTIKSFFPMGASTEPNSSPMQFQSFPTSDLLSRANNHSQDLRLSLQSFQDPILLHQHNQQPQQHQNPTHHTEQAHSHVQSQVLFGGHTPLGFDSSVGWSENQHQAADISRIQRLAAWNAGADTTGGGSGGSPAAAAAGYLFNSAPTQPPLLQQLLGQNQFFSQRGPLQSSNTPSIRAWMDPSILSITSADHSQHHQYPAGVPIYPSSISGIGFSSGVSTFSGFQIPARIQGDEEEHDGYSDKPSSASSDSRH